MGYNLTGPDGRTLYTFAQDVPGADKSACTGACTSTWRALTIGPRVGQYPPLTKEPGIYGVVGAFSISGTAKQVTYNGWPLYSYAGDTAPGDVKGHAFNDNWWYVPAGGPPYSPGAHQSR